MKKILLIALPILIFASCNKYEEGPMMSLRTKTMRLSNNWQMSSAYQNGVDKTSEFNVVFAGYQLDIRKDNTYTLQFSPGSTGTITDNGTWEWNGDKTHVVFTNSDGESQDYTILRLKEKELWMRFHDDNNDEWEVHLTPKN
ncbi:MAG TPA: lipocalin family protein [Bacteroidia bacterium]|nr:lipocalin family protein [Bacteroidia bacterium]